MSILRATVRTSVFRRSFSSACQNKYSGQSELDQQKWLPVDPSFATTAIHAGFNPKEDKYGFVVPSIEMSTTVVLEAPGVSKGYEYTRYGNTTRTALEKTLAALEKAKYGYAFSSGMAAVYNAITLLSKGDGVILTDSIYSGTAELFEKYATRFGITPEFIDMCSDTTALERTLKPNTKLVWLETPANPTLRITDIEKTCQIIRSYNKDIIVVVDNTFLSPYYQRPLALGADISLYSLTKYGNGHSDVLMGTMVTSREDIMEKLFHIQRDVENQGFQISYELGGYGEFSIHALQYVPYGNSTGIKDQNGNH
ncbi:unnamed protein product [Allacma fusca]|uniref:cystathionine gamma-lyase n=1 Tax=Allacma fusca TaxID=39272 RepID=A0A8J2J624_9HEXA|nr:unnamed protein product [Allacma fusca]